MNNKIRQEQTGWGASDSLNYYRTHRKQPEDLYESEKFFLPEILPRVTSVLDVGCAAGGFSRIMRSFNPNLNYSGVDITPELIEAARRDYPDCQFELSDGVAFSSPAESFDLVHCSGVLHLNSSYQNMITSMWAQTRRFLLCDFRLTREPSQTGEMEIRFEENARASRLPYHVLNVDELTDFLRSLQPVPSVIRAKGYAHAVSTTANVQLQRVIMAFFLIEKGANGNTNTVLDLQIADQ